MSLNLLSNYDKLFFNILKKSISMKNEIINSFCKSDKREVICEDENKINYTSSPSHILKHIINDQI